MADIVVSPRVSQVDIISNSVKPRHLEQGLSAVKFGTAENRPEVGTVYPVYFSLDSNVLSIWNGNSWVSTTLT